MVKVIGEDDDSAARERLIHNEWVAFQKTSAWKDLLEYTDKHKEMLLNNAQEMVMTSPADGKKVTITPEISNLLLQNRRGMDIVMTYIRLRSE